MTFPYYQTQTNYAPSGTIVPPNYSPRYTPTAMQPQQQSINTSGIIWVNNEQEAQMYPVAPNNAVALWDVSGKVVYLKQADATGKPTVRVYDLTEREQAQPAEAAPPEYVTREDYAKMVAAVKSLLEEVKQLKADKEKSDDT